MPREKTIEQALDMFDAWEAAVLAAERQTGRPKLKDVVSGLEHHVGRKVKVRPVRRKRVRRA
jgi:hypothetical protein